MTYSLLLAIVSVHGQAPAQAPPQTGRAGGTAARVVPPARIVSFTAEPSSIQAGQPVTLVWAAENPNATTIDQGIGRVTARGSREVFPSATTSYTLTVTGPNNTTLTSSVTVTVSGAKTATTATPAPLDLHVDLNGVYGFAGVRGAEPPPLKPGAEKFRIVRGPNDVRGTTTLGTDCKPLGVPQSFVTPYPFQIVQTPKLILMVFEYPNAIRFIPTDGRAHPVDPDPTWMGDSVAHWEGDTLVVDTIGFNDKTEVSGFMHTESLHVVERFRRVENGSLQYDVTVEDPNVFTRPWVLPTRTLPVRPEVDHVDEFVCETSKDYDKLFDKK
jgi:plastocyanin